MPNNNKLKHFNLNAPMNSALGGTGSGFASGAGLTFRPGDLATFFTGDLDAILFLFRMSSLMAGVGLENPSTSPSSPSFSSSSSSSFRSFNENVHVTSCALYFLAIISICFLKQLRSWISFSKNRVWPQIRIRLKGAF